MPIQYINESELSAHEPDSVQSPNMFSLERYRWYSHDVWLLKLWWMIMVMIMSLSDNAPNEFHDWSFNSTEVQEIRSSGVFRLQESKQLQSRIPEIHLKPKGLTLNVSFRSFVLVGSVSLSAWFCQSQSWESCKESAKNVYHVFPHCQLSHCLWNWKCNAMLQCTE